MANEVVDVVAIDADEQGTRGDSNQDGQPGGEGGNDMEMEMEGWDGVGERPFKRVARNLRRDLADSDEERDGTHGDGGTPGGGGTGH